MMILIFSGSGCRNLQDMKQVPGVDIKFFWLAGSQLQQGQPGHNPHNQPTFTGIPITLQRSPCPGADIKSNTMLAINYYHHGSTICKAVWPTDIDALDLMQQ
jgi:hypothetical protein